MIEAPEEFASLMTRARDGDRKALCYFLSCYEREVSRAARHLLGPCLRSSLDPADLVQSVHRTLLLCLREDRIKVTSPSNLVALALTVAHHKAVRAARRHRCRQRHSASLTETTSRAALTTCPFAETDPARVAEFKDTVENLCKGLSDLDRRLIQLRLQGHSTADVARLLGLNSSVLRVRLRRLRQQLRASHGLTERI
jgi:RNA polymerase sigma-70 factor (ECF subfamily)